MASPLCLIVLVAGRLADPAARRIAAAAVAGALATLWAPRGIALPVAVIVGAAVAGYGASLAGADS